MKKLFITIILIAACCFCSSNAFSVCDGGTPDGTIGVHEQCDPMHPHINIKYQCRDVYLIWYQSPSVPEPTDYACVDCWCYFCGDKDIYYGSPLNEQCDIGMQNPDAICGEGKVCVDCKCVESASVGLGTLGGLTINPSSGFQGTITIPEDYRPFNFCNNGIWSEGQEECDYSAAQNNNPPLYTQCVASGINPSPDGKLECIEDTCKCVGCGDTVLDQLAGEQCEKPGALTANTCKDASTICDFNTCLCTTCGNGNLDANEQCDDTFTDKTVPEQCEPVLGYLDPTAVCSHCTCKPHQTRSCENGSLDVGEECDMGGPVLFEDQNDPNLGILAQQCQDTDPQYGGLTFHIPTGCTNCECNWCGDGEKNGNEQCDFKKQGDVLADCPDVAGKVAVKCTEPTLVSVSMGEFYYGGCQCEYKDLGDCGDEEWNYPPEECDESAIESGPGPWDKMCDGHPEWCKDCICQHCGNGVLEGTETCEDGIDPSQWKCPTPENNIPMGDYYDCVDCQCFHEASGACHDGVFQYDPDPASPTYEECDADGTFEGGQFPSRDAEQENANEKCDPGEICLWNCTCWQPTGDTPPPPLLTGEEPELEQTCVIRITGSFNEEAAGELEIANENVHNITGDKNVDLVGEEGFSVAYIDIVFPGTSAGEAVKLAKGIKALSIKGVEGVPGYQVAPWTVLQNGGIPPTDYNKYTYQPIIKPLDTTVVLWPVLNEQKAQSLGVKGANLMPDLSSVMDLGAVTLTDITAYLGSENTEYEVSQLNAMKLNNFISWEVAAAQSAVKAELPGEVGVSYQKGQVRIPFGPTRWTGVEGFELPEGMKEEELYIENRQRSMKLVMDEIEQRMASGQYKNVCEVMWDLDYDDFANQQYTVAQGQLESAKVLSQKFAVQGVTLEQAQGMTGCNCNMSAAVPSASHLILIFGMAATGLGSILAVRKRKRRKK